MGISGNPVGSPTAGSQVCSVAHSLFPIRHLLRVLSGLAIFCCVLGGTVLAEVRVQTSDGRVLSGVVDTRTDGRQLWLRRSSETIVLTSNVNWDSIETATLDDRPITAESLRQQYLELADQQPTGFLVEYGPPAPLAVALPAEHLRGRVTSLEVDARLVNLDRTVEPDGYEIAIAAVDEFGNEVPVRGNLYVRLQGERNEHYSGRIRFENFQQWNQVVSPLDFHEGVALYVFQFRDFAPEFDDELRPDAQLNVRLGVFGEGNFSATIPVPLWEFSPFRDRLQKFEGSRFFRDEVSHRPRHFSTDPPGIYRRRLAPGVGRL